jgi:hypothetical protein
MNVKSKLLFFVLILIITVILVGGVLFMYFADKISVYIPTDSKNNSSVIEESKTANKDEFYGVNVDMSQILPGAENYIVNRRGEDLIDMSAKLGINLFRVTNSSPAFADRHNGLFTKEEWDQVLNKMQDKGIKAIILIESPRLNPDDYSESYINLADAYVLRSKVLEHPNVYAVDIRNEPTINVESNIAAMKKVSEMVKHDHPKMLITVGWWRLDTFKKNPDGTPIFRWDAYSEGKVLEDIVDFYSLHLYALDKSIFGIYPDPYKYTLKFIEDVENGLQTEKPLLIEEFGAANGKKITDQGTNGSPEQQAQIYDGIYRALITANETHRLLGSAAFSLYTKDNHTDGWDLIKDNGDYIYPAARVLEKYAKKE